MKGLIYNPRIKISISCIVLLVMFAAPVLAGEEGPPDWRPMYDRIMLYINFVILAFILVKFGRKPLMNFLRNKKDDVQYEIERLEKKRDKIVSQIRETEATMTESEVYFQSIHDRIVNQATRKKDEIIETAKEQSALILENAKKKAESRYKTEMEKLRDELVDIAIQMAFEQIPQEINETDQEKYISQYLSVTSKYA